MKKISEIQSDHVNDENYRCIDVWETNDGDEEGKTVAIFCEDTGKSYLILMDFCVLPEVKSTLQMLKSDWDKIQQDNENVL